MATEVVQRRTLVISIAGAAIVGLVLGVLMGRYSGGAQDRPEASTPPDAGPRSVSNGVPVGYTRTEEGAVVAATNFALVPSSDLIGDREALIRAAETFAAPSWKEAARQQAERGYEFAADHYGSDFQLTTSVVRYRLVSFTSNAATVRLWTVTVATGSKRPSAEAVWGTSSLDLEWIDGDWRVRNTQNETGPAPVPLQSSPDEATQPFLEDLNEFSEGPRP